MKKTVWILAGVLLLAAVLILLPGKGKNPEAVIHPETTACREETEGPSESTETVPAATQPKLPDSILYYGEILKIIADEQGTLRKLSMDSQRHGPYLMNLSERTVFIDSGERKAFDPSILQPGDRVYVFMSPISARSMPPQSAAFAVVRNIPMDAGCAMYHEIEKLEEESGRILITTDNGEKTLLSDENTELLTYDGEGTEKSQLKAGGFLMAWYWDQGEEILHASHLMILPEFSLKSEE